MGRLYTCKKCGHKYHRDQYDKCPECVEVPDETPEPVPTELPKEEKLTVDTAEYTADVVIVNNHATMRFQNQLIAGKKVYCPRCGRRQFDVHLLIGSMEQRCGKCKLDITMIFL